MSRTPQSPASRPGWPRRHKRLLTLAGIILLLIAVVGISALYYIRSGKVNSFILTQVQAALSEYGVRADIGGLDLSWGVRTAKAHDIKLYNLESGDLIAAIDNAELVVEIPDL